jgi:hypothetical protein
MKKLAVAAFLLLAAPAAAQQCMPLSTFVTGVLDQGYEFAAQAKDGDGDSISFMVHKQTKNWIAVFVPQSAPHVACLLATGTEWSTSKGAI